LHSSPPWIRNRGFSGVVVVRVVHQWKQKNHTGHISMFGEGFQIRRGFAPVGFLPCGCLVGGRGGGSGASQRHCEAAQGSTAGTRHGEGGPKARGEGRRDGQATPELDRSAPRIGKEGAAAVIRTKSGGRRAVGTAEGSGVAGPCDLRRVSPGLEAERGGKPTIFLHVVVVGRLIHQTGQGRRAGSQQSGYAHMLRKQGTL